MEFKDLNLAELDKDLTQIERDEWNALYASFRSSSVVSGIVAGVDEHTFEVIPEGKKRPQKQTLSCLIIIPHRVKVIIPETEIFIGPLADGGYVLHSMYGARLDYVVTHIDREEGFAVASRKRALEKLQITTSRKSKPMGKIVDVEVLSVGKNICTVTYNGYDVRLNQREVSYSSVADLRETLKPGDIQKALVTEFSEEEKTMKLSIKDALRHPFDGIEMRHPIGSSRMATISGKYAGGVFCRLKDNVTDVLCSYSTMHNDGDFQLNNSVEILIQKYNMEKKLAYGKILRKMY